MSLKILLLICVLLPAVEPACAPVEEGKPTTLTCNVNSVGCSLDLPVLKWRSSNPETVIYCYSDACGGQYSPQYISATISPTSSILTINSVSRTVPFNMETEWECEPCVGRASDTVCEKLEVYALPSNPRYQVTENLVSGDIQSVTFACTSKSVYPRAKCSLYKIKDKGEAAEISKSLTTSSSTVSSNPVYYSTECSVTLTVQELGEGTHKFQGKIYPGVTGGEDMVDWIKPDKTVTFSFPQVFHSCMTNMVPNTNYFDGKSATCTCSLEDSSSAGNPRATAQWYRGPTKLETENGRLEITFDRNNAEQTFTCEALSALGQRPGSTLTAMFTFLSDDSILVIPPSSSIKLCVNNNRQAQVTCQISREDVSPAPTFSFSVSELTGTGTESSDSVYYQRQFSFTRDQGGEYQVFCQVTNVIKNTNQVKSTQVVFQEPPPGPPRVTISGQTYQGTVSTNIVTLAEGYSGDVTCHVRGGYPVSINTKLECDQLKDIGPGNSATLSFKDNSLRRDMNGKVCTCTGNHVSGCYGNKMTTVTLDVTYPPDVTFTKPETKFNKGDSLIFTCSAQGNPDPTLTLNREGTDDLLKGPQTTTLTHTLDSLDCLDTGVYVCSGQNSQGTDSKNILVNVRCPQQFSHVFEPQPVIDAVMGSTAQIDLEVYGFPEPTSLTLKTADGTNITTSGRHIINYTSGDVPFGNVTVTIFDIVESDFLIYTLSVYNGVGAALTYTFFLNQVSATVLSEKEKDTEKSSSSENLITTIIIIAVIAVIIVASLVVFNFFTLRRYQNLKKILTTTGVYLTPIDTPDIVHNVASMEAPRPGQYEDVDGVRGITNITPNPAGVAPESNQDRATIRGSPVTHSVMVSASERPEINHYETIPDTVTRPSGPYNSVSHQDVEPPTIYNRAIHETPSNTNTISAGTYRNISGQAGTHDSASRSPSTGTAMTSLPNTNHNNVVLPPSVAPKWKQPYQNVDLI